MSRVELYSKEVRKSNGVFYTPDFLAQYLAKKVVYYWRGSKLPASILDPACGDSVLLGSYAEEFLLDGKEKTLPKIIGIDKDINAVISSSGRFSNKIFKKIPAQFFNLDSLFPYKGQSTVNAWAKLRKKVKCQQGFDVVLSNPPWGADLTEYDTKNLYCNFNLARGQFDIYDLFVEMILNNLNDKGIYGLILPDSIFYQEHARLRCLFAENTTIYLIARLGEKIFREINRACVIVVGSKAKAPSNHKVDCFRLSSYLKQRVLSNELMLEEAENELTHKVKQSRFIENDNCVFNIDLRNEEQQTFDKIQNTNWSFRDVVRNTRGAEISKKGIVCQCPKCKYWMPYPKAKIPRCCHCDTKLNLNSIVTDKIISNSNGGGKFKLKVGEDLFRYTSISNCWINTCKKGINYKDLNIYRGDKILVRKTGVGITASLDYENSITNQVVYIFKLKPTAIKKLSLEFVLAVLNSRAMTYYLIKKYGENEWKSHPYLTQTMLVNLPFPDVDFCSKKHKSLINKVTKIIRSEVIKSKNKNISIINDLLIERIVAEFYKLNRIDYKTIFETLSSAEQLIPIKRLLTCKHNEIFKINGI